EVAPGGPAFGAGGARGRIDPDVVHRRQVGDHTALGGAEPGNAVPAAAHGQLQAVVPGVVHRGDDVPGGCAPHDDLRVPVEHRVLDFAGFIVPLVLLGEHPSPGLLQIGRASGRARGCTTRVGVAQEA